MTVELAPANNGTPAPAADVVPVEKLHAAKAEAEDLRRKLDQFKDIDPSSYKAMREDYELMRKQQTGGDPKKIDELVAAKEIEIRSSVQKELDALKGDAQTKAAKLKELQVTEKVFSQAADKFNKDTYDDVKEYIRRFCDIGDDGEIFVKDEKGARRYSPGSTTKYMGVDEFVGWLSDLKPSWAVAEGNSGAKTSGQKTTSTSGAKVLSWKEIGQLPDKGKTYMNNLANTDREAFNALMLEAKF